MDDIFITISGFALIFIATTLGSALVFFFKKDVSDRLNAVFLGSAAGIMIAASVWSLLIPSIDGAKGYERWSFVPATVGFVLGGFFSNRASGIMSSATTNIIAPAANANSHGCAFIKVVARKYPTVAATGSTAPLPVPNKNALILLPVALLSGKDTAAPSGKFCIAIPNAKPNAENSAA